MKKLFSVFVVLMSLTVMGCQNSDDVFEKNIDCQKYKKELKRELLIAEPSSKLESIFYSPQKKSCLYVQSLYLGKKTFVRKTLIDFFTKNEVVHEFYKISEKDNQDILLIVEGEKMDSPKLGDFENIIKKYQ